MKKTVLTFGLISGAILSAMMAITLRFQDAIGFDRAPTAAHLPAGRRVDLVYALESDRWDGLERIRLHLRDLRPAVRPALVLSTV